MKKKYVIAGICVTVITSIYLWIMYELFLMMRTHGVNNMLDVIAVGLTIGVFSLVFCIATVAVCMAIVDDSEYRNDDSLLRRKK